ncbi:MAG: bifunctional adenosylcobinamide kinase/adenosylcobinamide-phosphate guanylyltransferase [Alicyclobacillus sp.]|nr:bifunctional adenosylcobinamide kinase/adenosylcobinamide-phosphate guanylyltransferase [Alicyclobacillus sp.]
MGYTLVLGGARSGKSGFAEHLAHRMSEVHGLPVTFIATAERTDQEMEERIRRHREGRPASWDTVEIPLEVAAWLQAPRPSRVVLIDCLSLLLNNWLFLGGCDEEEVHSRTHRLVEAMATTAHRVVVVSNEVGQGIVPADFLSRRYRDWLGWMNQKAAAEAAQVVWMVAGIPVDVRKLQVPLP